jgi:hypothetical protein
MSSAYIAPPNQVPSCPGWAYGLAVLTSDGSLYGTRIVEVYRPDGQAEPFTVVSAGGWADIHSQAIARILGTA